MEKCAGLTWAAEILYNKENKEEGEAYGKEKEK